MGTFVSSRQVRQNINLMTPWWLSGASIDLDFDNARYYDSSLGGNASLAPLNSYLSISRASTGYAKTAAGTLTSFGNDTLRITDLGLLVEDARTNILLDSPPNNTGNWNSAQATTTVNAAVAPDGTTTAASILPTAGTLQHRHSNTSFTTTTGQNTASCFFKIGTGGAYGFATMTASSNTNGYGIIFNLSTGAITDTHTYGTVTSPSAAVEAYGSGWWRASITFSGITAVNLNVGPHPTATASAWNANTLGPDYNGDGTSTGLIWGAQVELGAFASSYIPTAGASATRAADNVSCTGNLASILGTLPVSVLADITSGDPGAADSFYQIIANNAVTSRALLSVTSGSTNVVSIYDGSLLSSGNFPGGLTLDGGVKVASGSATGARSVVGGGGTVTAGTGGTALTNPSIGGNVNAGEHYNGLFRRVVVWNSKLADATLQALTA